MMLAPVPSKIELLSLVTELTGVVTELTGVVTEGIDVLLIFFSLLRPALIAAVCGHYHGS